jgi:uncharacterized protein YndB with AHSA1/START domain
MGRKFEIVREYEVRATPEQVWDAITDNTAAWLWPMEYEHREGGAAPFGGRVAVWDPPHHLVGRVDGEDGWFNQLDHTIEARDGGRSWLRYVHSGIFTDDWDNQYDGADQHTDFYQHTLRQYLEHFTGRTATFAEAQGPASANRPDAFEALRRALGLRADVGQGDKVQVTAPGLDGQDAVVDYRTPNFIGISTDDAMYRFFGRNAFGDPVGLTVHHFGAVDREQTQRAWQAWLDGVYA